MIFSFAITRPLPYTTSLDAARTLVPEGWITTIDHYCLADNPKENIWRAWLRKLQGNLVEEDDPIYLIKMFGSAPTPALALCIAALKARQESGPAEVQSTPDSHN